MKNFSCWILLLLISFLFVGCSNDRYEQTKKNIEQIKNRSAHPIEPLPEIKVVQTEHYSAKQLRSPFYRTVVANRTGEPDLRRPKEILEGFPLDALKLVGSVTKGNVIWALIRIPDGTIYPVTIGNYIGKNFGRLIKITDKEIEIVELMQIGGEWRQNKAALILNQDKKAK